jgi:colanic acid/amylovoran biosynthesis glycosyltransferase
MRIAVVCHSFPAVSETFILRQITGLIDMGHEVDIYADGHPADNPVHPEFAAYRLHEKAFYADIPGKKRRRVFGTLRLAGSMMIKPWVTFDVLGRISRPTAGAKMGAFFRLWNGLAHRHTRYDVIHCHQGYVANNYLFMRRLWDAAFVVSFHGADFSVWPGLHGRDIYKELFAEADCIIVNTSFTGRRVRDLGCPEAKIRKLPVGLNLEEFSFKEREAPSHGPVRVLTVGRLVEKKGFEYSIRAFSQVKRKFANTRYDIIGEGPLRSRLQGLIGQLSLGDAVTLHGARDIQFVRSLMQQSHIFVLASVTGSDGNMEGQGLVLQEAQACGLPILATDHNGFAEGIVPGKSGFLVPERDVDALARGLEYLVSHPGVWAEMGSAGRVHVEANYNQRLLTGRLADIYSFCRECKAWKGSGSYTSSTS